MPARAAFASWLDDANDVTSVFLEAAAIPGLINLGGGLPDPSIWPVETFAELARSAVADHAPRTLAYGPVAGFPEFRDLVARRFSSGALKLSRENVLITTSGMQALDLVGKALLDEGAPVACQSPAYLGALDAWKPRRPLLRPMRLEANDLDVQAAMTGARFAYAVPNFSNPSGRLVPEEQRRALIDAAEATGCWLVEDDPYGALYYDDAPLPTMLEMSATGEDVYRGPVIYMGTFSKELAPGLRIGWIVASPEAVAAMCAAKQGSDMCTSGITQRIAFEALDSGLDARMLPDILDLYRARRDALCDAMEAHLGDLYDWTRPSGGMFVWATAKDASLDTDALMRRGLEHGVCVSPSSVFDPAGEDRRSIRLNFTLNPPEALAEAVRRLAEATRAELAAA